MNYIRFFSLFLLCFVCKLHAWGWRHSSDLDTYLQNNYFNDSNKPFTAGVDINKLKEKKKGKICNLGKGEPNPFLKGMTEYEHDVVTGFQILVPNHEVQVHQVHVTSVFCCGLVNDKLMYLGVGPEENSFAVYSQPSVGGYGSAFGIMVFAEGEL